jgi:pimeloyl-ACP methyl ester carboxylesterase
MGAEDHLFLPSIKNIVSKHVTSSLFVVDNCGHVVNVEQPEAFNNQTIRFISSLKA